jgi:bifunctional DNase/RNase
MRRLPLLLALAVSLLAACGDAAAPSEIAVRVGYVAMDPRHHAPVVLLEEVGGSRVLPIWIGFAEARSIADELRQAHAPRPGTHDLAKRLIDRLEGRLLRVVVNDLDEGVYYALLVLQSNGRTLEVDARPSDAIAIALRFQAPVFVREDVFDESAQVEGDEFEPGHEI